MPGLFSIASAELRSKRFTSALTIVAIALGTAVVVATFATNVAVEDSMSRTAAALVGQADIVVDAVDDAGFPNSAVKPVREIPLVTKVAPQVHKRVFFRTASQRGFVEIVGIDPSVDPDVHPYHIAVGRFFDTPDREAVLLGRDWAATYGLKPGDTVELITADGFKPFTVVGLLEEADLSQRGSAGIVRVPLAEAQSAFGFTDRVQSLYITVDTAGAREGVAARLEAVLPYVFVARDSGAVLADLRASINDFEVALYFFGIVALLAGAVLVFNTLSLTVVERRQQIGLLRAIGASPGYIVRLMLAQGMILGAAGAVVGLVLGQILAAGLAVFVARTQGLPIGGFPFSLTGAWVSVALGVGVTLVSTVLPALRAGRTPPIAAMSATRATPPTGRGATTAVLTIIAIALAAFVVAPLEGDAVRAAKGLGLIVLLPLLIYVSRLLVPALAGIGALVVRRFSHGIGTLAEGTVRRERGQTALTVASFVIGLGLIVALSGGAASFTAAGQQWAQGLFPGQLVVVSPIDEPFALVSEFESVPGVDQVSPVSSHQVVWQGLRLTAVGVDPAHYFQAFQITSGERTAAFKQMRRGDGVLIPQAFATEMELNVGDTLSLSAGGFDGDFVVAGIIAHSLPTPDSFGALIIPEDAMQGLFGVNTFRFLAVSAAPDADLSAVARDLQSTAESFGMQASLESDLARSVGTSVGALLAPLAGLVVIAVVVGSLGLANTMALNIGQRVREIAILRATGLRGDQVPRLAIAEASILGFLGALLGVMLGAFLTYVLVQLSRTPDVEPPFAFSTVTAVAVIVAGVVVAVIASLYPARLAARIDILHALRSR